MKTLVLFDFDGTITKKDTFLEFIKFSNSKTRFYSKIIGFLYFFILQKIKIISPGAAKAKILKLYFFNTSKSDLETKGQNFIDYLYSKGVIKTEMQEHIEEYKSQNFDVFIVSASFDAWIKPFANRNNIKSICTELAYENNIFLGELSTENCNYEQKLIRIKQKINLTEYSEIIVYGDSSGDKSMMSIATQAFWVK